MKCSRFRNPQALFLPLASRRSAPRSRHWCGGEQTTSARSAAAAAGWRRFDAGRPPRLRRPRVPPPPGPFGPTPPLIAPPIPQASLARPRPARLPVQGTQRREPCRVGPRQVPLPSTTTGISSRSRSGPRRQPTPGARPGARHPRPGAHESSRGSGRTRSSPGHPEQKLASRRRTGPPLPRATAPMRADCAGDRVW